MIASDLASQEFAWGWLQAEHEALDGQVIKRPSRPPDARPNGDAERVRIGLAGPSVGYGLAQNNHDIAHFLHPDRWLVSGRVDILRPTTCRIDSLSREMSSSELEAWLDGLDVVIFVERPPFELLPFVAAAMNVRVVCVPNWEWLQPTDKWLRHVDLMLCPTRHTFDLVRDWSDRFGFAWRVAWVPWPTDTARFAFRLRRRCDRFVFVNGSGGWPASPKSSASQEIRRKALDTTLRAAELVPQVPIIIYADEQALASAPANVIRRSPPFDNRELYRDGDVCLQPSHWEGIGLPLLECQSAGMPLITVDAPPMNEYRPLATVPAELTPVQLTAEHHIPAAMFSPSALAEVLRDTHGRRIARDSRAARRFILAEHAWPTAAARMRREIEFAVRIPNREHPG